MKSFFAACVAAIILAVIGAVVRDGVFQESSEDAFTVHGVRT
jgi:uncharacterized membrane protein YvlD (DUF360 family)